MLEQRIHRWHLPGDGEGRQRDGHRGDHPEKLTGDVLFVDIPGETLPGIGMSFTGRYSQRVLSRVKVDRASGRLLTAFEAIPDLPLTSLDLTIDGGARGPIQFSDEVCKSASSWDASLSGQGGQTSKVKIPFDCSSPAPATSVSWTRRVAWHSR